MANSIKKKIILVFIILFFSNIFALTDKESLSVRVFEKNNILNLKFTYTGTSSIFVKEKTAIVDPYYTVIIKDCELKEVQISLLYYPKYNSIDVISNSKSKYIKINNGFRYNYLIDKNDIISFLKKEYKEVKFGNNIKICFIEHCLSLQQGNECIKNGLITYKYCKYINDQKIIRSNYVVLQF